MKRLFGSTRGLKANQISRLGNLYRRRIPPQYPITTELVRDISTLSRDIHRQIGLMINRPGKIVHVIVGDHQGIVIPDTREYRIAPGRLRGLRCVHTHLKDESLTEDDLTDLALLRLDIMAAITVDGNGRPGLVHVGHLLPGNNSGEMYRILPPLSPHRLDIGCQELIHSLESELVHVKKLYDADSGKERALLVSVTTATRHEAEEHLDELCELAGSCGITVLGTLLQRRKKTDTRFLMGRGKLRDLTIRALREGATLALLCVLLVACRASADLSSRLDAALADPALKGAKIAALVADRDSGASVFERNPDRALIPASNQKLLTALVALDTFGPAHQFETEILADRMPDAEGRVARLFVRGSGDPALTSEQLWRLAADLRRGGLKSVGDLVLDASVLDDERWNPVWGKVSSRAYHSPVGGISANYGAFAVEIRPGEARGLPAQVAVDPPIPYLVLTNQASTGAKGTGRKLKVERSAAGGVEQVTVTGTIAMDSDSRAYYRGVSDPVAYAGAVLRWQLEANGISVTGGVERGTVPANAESLFVFKGFPLSEVVQRFMKYSNNTIAETLVKLLGVNGSGAPGSWATGVPALHRRLEELGLAPSSMRLSDGSGLSRENRVPPRSFVGALQLADASFAWGPELIAALPIAAADGTLEKRANGSIGRVRAKTGLLTGVTGLSGFARSKSGEDYVFSILVNGYPHGDRAAMNALDRFVEVLSNH